MKPMRNTYTFRSDPSFTPEKLREYDLVFQVTPHSCAFSLFDTTENRYIGIADADVPLAQVRGEIPWIGKSARSVKIIIENNRSTLVPEDLFEEQQEEAYLKFVVDEKDDETVLHDHIRSLELIDIYGVNEALLEQVTGIYPDAEIRHVSGVLIDSAWLNFKNRLDEKRIFLNVRNDDFNMLIFGNRQLLFSNAFPVAAAEDLVYYLLFVMEQHHLNPEDIPVTLMGQVDEKSLVFDLLKRYVRKVDFAPRNGSVLFSPVFDDLPGQFYYTLLNPVR
jgi:hypothetical protein